MAAHLRAHHAKVGITTAITDRSGPTDVIVDVRGLAVILTSCPNWSRDVAADTANRAMSNLGCATAHNLGMMLDDPRDLERGAALVGADGTREADAVVRYRTDKVKTLQNELSQP